MSVSNKILRGLLVLIVIAILALLVRKFAVRSYLYPGIVIAFIIAAGVAFLAFRSPGTTTKKDAGQKASKNSDIESDGEMESEAASESAGKAGTDNILIEPDVTDTPPRSRKRIDTPFRSLKPPEVKSDASEVTARYLKMEKGLSEKTPAPPSDDIKPKKEVEAAEPASEKDTGSSPIPIIEDESSLTEEDKNELVNAVWYRCENPYCKYTQFLSVHHIIDEKNGGSNKLDNLIVFCTFCHDLAHRNEIPEKEMRAWISNREERFKTKLDWRY